MHQDLEHLETAYVVKCHRVALLAEPLPVFTFDHPNWATHIDNTRSIELQFEPSSSETPSATMHGCAHIASPCTPHVRCTFFCG